MGPLECALHLWLQTFPCLLKYVHWHVLLHTNNNICALPLHGVSLSMLPSVSGGDDNSVLLGVFTVVHFWEETTSTHRARSMLDHPAYVFMCGGWVTIWDVFLIAGEWTRGVSAVAPLLLFRGKRQSPWICQQMINIMPSVYYQGFTAFAAIFLGCWTVCKILYFPLAQHYLRNK